MKFVLIMWVANSFSPFTQAALTAEFDSYEACNTAYVYMVNGINKQITLPPDGRPRIVGGCFKK